MNEPYIVSFIIEPKKYSHPKVTVFVVDDTRLELAAGLSLSDCHPAPYPLAVQAQTEVTSSNRNSAQ